MPKKPDAPTRAPAAYTASQPVYMNGIFTKAGEVFVTDAEPADDWTPLDNKQATAIQASTNEVPGDAPIENLDVAALQALATAKHVNTSGIEQDKDALITAIKAAQEPAL